MNKTPYQAAIDYHVNCELYDRRVCTGPLGKDGALPATFREKRLINANAQRERFRAAREAAVPLHEIDKMIRNNEVIDEANFIVRQIITEGKEE